MTVEAIRYRNGALEIIDKSLFPGETKYIRILGVEDGWKAINEMKVCGAPAIAIVGFLSLVVEVSKQKYNKKIKLRRKLNDKLGYLLSAKPTAVNLKMAVDELMSFLNTLYKDDSISAAEMQSRFISEIEAMLEKDLADNKAISMAGCNHILNETVSDGDGCDGSVTVMTYCNTGSLATAGYGTALGIIRALHASRRLEHVFCTDRSTSYELVHDKVPSTLICDGAVSALMKTRSIAALIVGAETVAANGDTANPIGTYQIAVTAKYHSVPFYVAVPFTAIDFRIANGENILIKERPDREIDALGISCWNPAFDITPAELITAFITEKGVFKPNELGAMEKTLDILKKFHLDEALSGKLQKLSIQGMADFKDIGKNEPADTNTSPVSDVLARPNSEDGEQKDDVVELMMEEVVQLRKQIEIAKKCLTGKEDKISEANFATKLSFALHSLSSIHAEIDQQHIINMLVAITFAEKSAKTRIDYRYLLDLKAILDYKLSYENTENTCTNDMSKFVGYYNEYYKCKEKLSLFTASSIMLNFLKWTSFDDRTTKYLSHILFNQVLCNFNFPFITFSSEDDEKFNKFIEEALIKNNYPNFVELTFQSCIRSLLAYLNELKTKI